MPTLKLSLSIGYPSAGHRDELEIPEEDLEGLTEEEINKYCEECWIDWSNNYIEGGWDLYE